MSEFRMPSLGADMEAGTLVQWHVQVGDHVKHGDVVAEVETEKGLIEIEIFESGLVEKLLVEPGQTVPVGTPLAMVRYEKTAATVRSAEPAAAMPEPVPKTLSPTPGPPTRERIPTSAQAAQSRQHVSPHARKRAAELGIDVKTIIGSGEGGAVIVADVERAAAVPAPSTAIAPAPVPLPMRPPTSAQVAAMRHAIATAMSRSKRDIPHYYLAARIDMQPAMQWLAIQNQNRPIDQRFLYAVLLLRAVSLAVSDVPEMNGHWVDGAFRPSAAVHLGIAIALRSGGLVAPAIRDADRLSLEDLSQRLLDLVKRARAGALRSSEISGATITVTNLGEQGVESVFGVIYPPQVALVGFGKVIEQPWSAQGIVSVRPVINVTLSADHRASDGHRGGRFLAAIDRLLQQPEKL